MSAETEMASEYGTGTENAENASDDGRCKQRKQRPSWVGTARLVAGMGVGRLCSAVMGRCAQERGAAARTTTTLLTTLVVVVVGKGAVEHP